MPKSPQPRTARQAADQVAERLRQAGHQALFAGGCVRDLLMGREPADYDVATDARPEQVCRLFSRTLQVGAQFGVVIVLVGRSQVEVATFRSEADYSDGRHPEQVHFSDARQDALRRDFTINGMFLDPLSGEIIDYVGGQADLAARLVRAIGDPAERFSEDRLRMLRAVRFACVLGFQLDGRTAEAIRRNAQAITTVSAERIWQEWEKLLADANRQTGWVLAVQTALAAALWPGLSPQAERIRLRLARLAAEADATTALACQFAELAVEEVHRACRDLALDNMRRQSVAWLVAHARDLLEGELDIVGLKKLMADEDWPRLVRLARVLADESRGHGLEANLSKAATIPPEQVAPAPLIDGTDVLALGVEEGPAIGRILQQVYDAQLAGRVATREQALVLARRLAGP